MTKNTSIVIQDMNVNILNENIWDYISLTDMVRNLENWWDVIKNWIRNKSTINFLGVWEKLYNDNFNSVEFGLIRMEAWTPSFTLSVKKWIEKTQSLWIIAKTGKYWWTYTHKDIAFEFASAISPQFKLFLIKEYERLKQIENNKYNLEWDINRVLASINYPLQTKAIQDYIIPISNFSENKKWIHYAEEADILNVCVFYFTKKEWENAKGL